MSLALVAPEWDQDYWLRALRALAPDRDIQVWPDIPRPEDVRYALTWKPPQALWPQLPNLEGIVNLGAGVDALMSDPLVPDVPIARCVDPDLSARMAEYVTLHCLAHVRDVAADAAAQRDATWRPRLSRAASDVCVGLLGLGTLAEACTKPLLSLGFDVVGWSRSRREIAGVESYAGEAERAAFLARTDILVALLPLTAETRGILGADLFAELRRSPDHAPSLINVGRGGLQVEADILAALDDGTLDFATLDVFEPEPLPPANPLWHHPRVRITPHVSATSAPEALAAYVLRQVAHMEGGEGPEHPVDRARGY